MLTPDPIKDHEISIEARHQNSAFVCSYFWPLVHAFGRAAGRALIGGIVCIRCIKLPGLPNFLVKCETAALASEVEKFPQASSSLVHTSAVWWVGYITCLRHT